MKTLLTSYQAHKKALLLLFGTWGVFFFVLFIRIIEFKPDGLHAGHVNVWSDWSLHIGMASIFAYKDPQYWFAYHPMYAGGKLTYAFLTNFISGMLMRAGFSIYFAFIVPSIIYTLILLMGMYVLFYLILQSKKQVITAISCFFLSSGLGFIKFFRDILNGYEPQRLLYPNPAMDYSRLEVYQWYTGNFIVGMLIPQRSLLLGMAISLWAIAGLVYVLFKERSGEKKDRIILVISGVLVGLLPIAHTHSLIVVFLISAPMCAISFRRWRELLYYVIPASVLSITLYFIFIAGGIENPNFIQWLPGWTATGGLWRWIAMWLKIWGIMLPIAIFGFFLLRKQSLLIKSFFFSFFLVFIVANLWQFQPSPWDNSKLFLWAYFGLSGLAAVAISWGWRKAGKTISRFDVVLIVVALTFTGFLELIRLQSIERNQPQMTSWDDIHLGIEIRKKTHPLAVFLTAPSHNHLVMMWGVRPILLGDLGWVRNYGFLSEQREKDVKVMFQGGTDAETLLEQYKVSYVVIGPSELHDFQANESYYAQKYKMAFQNQHYRVYDVRSLWALK